MRFKLFVVVLLALSLNAQAQTRTSRRERRSITNAAALVADAPPARAPEARDN